MFSNITEKFMEKLNDIILKKFIAGLDKNFIQIKKIKSLMPIKLNQKEKRVNQKTLQNHL